MNHAGLHTTSIKVLPFKPVYILTPSAVTDVPDDVLICIRLNDDTLDEFAATFKRIRSASTLFMVLFDVTQRLREAADLLVHCLFSLNYYNDGGNPVLAFTARGENSGTYVDDVRDGLRKQGLHSITTWFIQSTSANADHGVAPLVFPADATPVDWARKVLFKDFESFTNRVIIDASSSAAASEIDDQLRLACESLAASQALFSDALENYLALKADHGRLLTDNRKLSRQLKGAETTIGVIRSKYKDDYENLFAWYHREYEILPLWYKRFGHIIKVIMGKRTFRSLFSDDVKKYKT